MGVLGKFLIFLANSFTPNESFRTYFDLTINECIKLGYNSIFLVSLVSLFMGAVTTIQTAYNIVHPLVPEFIVALVVRDMALLELSPTVIAIVLAGKVGSNIASELGTMRISEQIDALEVMGINPVSYLVLPKILASLIMYPCLVIISIFIVLTGGWLVCHIADVIPVSEYIYGIQYELVEFNVWFGLIKAFVFGFLISTISAFKGYFISGGALEVGHSSTAAVTSSCIGILSANYVLTQIFIL